MGTSYNIVVVDHNRALKQEVLHDAVEATLRDVNARFSNWDQNSEVSRFNRRHMTDPIAVSADFTEVMSIANIVHEASEGQFDVTLAPLVELWGFGAPGGTLEPPGDDAIAKAMARTGQQVVLASTNGGRRLRKTVPSASIYLAAIAKGYGIDKVAGRLKSMGASHYMVEIGGDLLTAGANPNGAPWRIGVERPDAAMRTVEDVVYVSGLGMATSGDYRLYFEYDGERYSHIIDATTGRPVTHATASVTVLAESAALADAWATALLALGSERGMPIAEKNEIAALFIDRRDDNGDIQFHHIQNERFARLQAYDTTGRP
ncbi:MAG: FAD:protein FMN transferase [Pseudomonadota bacterium]